jgi:glycosyltransferase involved in cell wall biosynthesis
VPGSGLSIVIPAWNEEERLGRTLDRYLPALEVRDGPFEVIVVADGVEDRTGEVAESYGHRSVRVLRFPNQLGKGGAILEGIQASQYDSVGYVDADGPILPGDLLALADGLSDFDCMIASRFVEGSRIVDQEPRFRRFAGRLWGSLVRSVLFLKVHDTQCGAKFFRRSSLLPVLKEVAVTNWAFDVSLLYHLAKAKRTIHEQPVTWSHHEDSHLVFRSAAPKMFLSLIGLRLMNIPVSSYVPRSLVERFVRELASV